MAGLSRRGFLKLTAGGSAAVAAKFGNKTADKLIPYVVPPEHVRPGIWTLFGTTCRECPAGCGMHLRHRNGRVVKPEGNRDHPVNRGGLCPRGQSIVQGLYDPERLKTVQHLEKRSEARPETWDRALDEIGKRLTHSRVTIISNLQAGALSEVMEQFAGTFAGKDRLLFYEAFDYEALREAHRTVFGRPEIPYYHLDQCDFILSLAADFMEVWVSNVEYAWQFSQMHSYKNETLNHFAYVGPRLSMTAVSADEFLQVAPDRIHLVALAMLQSMIEHGWAKGNVEALKAAVKGLSAKETQALTGVPPERIDALAKAFAHAKASVALAGPISSAAPPAREIATAAALLNQAAGRVGHTVDFSRTHALSKTATEEQVTKILSNLSQDDTLILHNANLVYMRPEAAEHIRKAGLVVYLGTMPDETAVMADWVLPVDFSLEAWGDYEPWTGYHSLLQPTMVRLYETKNAGDVFLALASKAGKHLARPGSEKPAADLEAWLKQRWEDLHKKTGSAHSFADFWTGALRAGGVWEKAKPASTAASQPQLGHLRFTKPGAAKSLSLWLWPNILFYDGHLANRTWIQEAPEPVSVIAWGTCLEIHPKTAKELGLAFTDVVELQTKAGKVEVSVRITEDVHENVAALFFGQGHTALGHHAAGRGANAFALLDPSERRTMFPTPTLRKTGKQFLPVYMYPTQDQYRRDLVQWISLEDIKKVKPGQAEPVIMPLPEGYALERDLYSPHEYKEHRWAMAVDLQRCIGCGACAIACYAENNIPVVGRERVQQGREMAWLKIVPYRHEENKKVVGFLPMLCQHCDAAPCEPVCPVFASVHNDEGLNAQVYNRCIGTRYCSNNCPYKVRRFNWLNIPWPKPLTWQLNPDVSVRCRGVMEKCTFCIQRIREVEVLAKREHRRIRDGEIQPACVQSCPARVYVFGDLMDPDAEVTKIFRGDPRRYQVLKELNTKPGIVYLKRITGNAKET